eukprot:UN02836
MIFALLKNEIAVVKYSLIGSVFSNSLLVLGCCLVAGGSKSRFEIDAIKPNCTLLLLAGLALTLPSPFVTETMSMDKENDETVLTISRITAVVLVLMYIQLLIWINYNEIHTDDNEEDEEYLLDAKQLPLVY